MQTTTPIAATDQGNSHPIPATRAPAPPHQAESVAHAPLWQRIVSGIIVFSILAAFSAYVLDVHFPGLYGHGKEDENKEPDDKNQPLLPGVSLVKGKPHTLEVPDAVRRTLGIRKGNQELLATVRTPDTMRPLVMTGSTALDPKRLARIRARFAPARVVEIAQVHDFSPRTGQTEFREIGMGDRVRKGDVLGVFYSVDVGSKKNDLLDALVQLQLDQEILDNAKKHETALPVVFMQTQAHRAGRPQRH